MAYTATVTLKRIAPRSLLVTITETEADATGEAEITGLPEALRLVEQRGLFVSGAGSTIDPILGLVTNPSGDNLIIENGGAAASVVNRPSGGTPIAPIAGSLFHRSVLDSASDNVTTIKYLFVIGWE